MPEIVTEKFLNGKSADVGQLTESGWVAWEVHLPTSCRSNLIAEMVAKDLRAGFVMVVICVLSAKDVEKVKAVVVEMDANLGLFGLSASVASRVEVKLLSDFLEPNGGLKS